MRINEDISGKFAKVKVGSIDGLDDDFLISD